MTPSHTPPAFESQLRLLAELAGCKVEECTRLCRMGSGHYKAKGKVHIDDSTTLASEEVGLVLSWLLKAGMYLEPDYTYDLKTKAPWYEWEIEKGNKKYFGGADTLAAALTEAVLKLPLKEPS